MIELKSQFGEGFIYTKFGVGIGINIYPNNVQELTARISYAARGGINNANQFHKDANENEMEQIRAKDIEAIIKEIQPAMENLETAIETALRKLGYK